LVAFDDSGCVNGIGLFADGGVAPDLTSYVFGSGGRWRDSSGA
jgi:hypothetical protein